MNALTPMGDMVNLIVDLLDERFDETAFARAHRETESAGFAMEVVSPGSDAYLAWIDDEFGGCWSSEAFAGSSVVTKSGEAFVGFAAFGARGLKFSWLRGLGAHEGVGIFGPFGVARAFRGSPAGPRLLVAALASMRRAGYTQALIPAVEHEKVIAYYEHHAGARVMETFSAAHWYQHRYRIVVVCAEEDENRQSIVDCVREGRLPLEMVSVRDEPELVLVLGRTRAEERFLEAFRETIAIHPAFLPLDPNGEQAGFPDGSITPIFLGPDSIRDALAFGSRWVGVTAHGASRDGGMPVFARKPLALRPNETPAEIAQRLRPLASEVLASAILRWIYER